MSAGGIVDHDPVAVTFSLPAAHAAFLTRANLPASFAGMSQFVAMLAQAEDEVVECFRSGGGVPYAVYSELMDRGSEISAPYEDALFISNTRQIVPEIVDRLEQGIDVADVGCGSGHKTILMAEAFPASRIVGYDNYDPCLVGARAEAARRGLVNVRFEKRDAATLLGAESFDFITTFDAVHDQARPDLVLRGIAKSLRPGGVYLCVDIRASSTLADNLANPLAPFFYTFSCMHCMTVSLAEGGMGLGAVWGEQLALKMIGDAGFASVEIANIEGDDMNNYYIAASPEGRPR
jgi:2-polyprenyl-3-methyl-5-hydroxy-6-metoxy-1,4-benzoquinol methylase